MGRKHRNIQSSGICLSAINLELADIELYIDWYDVRFYTSYAMHLKLRLSMFSIGGCPPRIPRRRIR